MLSTPVLPSVDFPHGGARQPGILCKPSPPHRTLIVSVYPPSQMGSLQCWLHSCLDETLLTQAVQSPCHKAHQWLWQMFISYLLEEPQAYPNRSVHFWPAPKKSYDITSGFLLSLGHYFLYAWYGHGKLVLLHPFCNIFHLRKLLLHPPSGSPLQVDCLKFRFLF